MSGDSGDLTQPWALSAIYKPHVTVLTNVLHTFKNTVMGF